MARGRAPQELVAGAHVDFAVEDGATVATENSGPLTGGVADGDDVAANDAFGPGHGSRVIARKPLAGHGMRPDHRAARARELHLEHNGRAVRQGYKTAVGL